MLNGLSRIFRLTVGRTSYAGDALWIADRVPAGKPRIKAKRRFHQYTGDPPDKNVADFSGGSSLKEWAEAAPSPS